MLLLLEQTICFLYKIKFILEEKFVNLEVSYQQGNKIYI